MTTTLPSDRILLVRRLMITGSTVIVLAVAATLAAYPSDPVLDWLDILQETIFLVGGLGALWAAWRAESPLLTVGGLMLTGSLALDLADEFITPALLPSQWIPTALSAGGLGTFAAGLAGLAARERDGRRRLQRSEQQIRDQQSQLEIAATKDEFIAALSHELRTPLTALSAAAGHLGDSGHGTLSEAQQRELAIIAETTEGLLAMIGDILELSRLESGRASILLQAVDIGSTCDAAWTRVSARAQAKALDVTFSVPRNAGSLFSDGRRLGQMLVLLLDNAVKFTPAGGRIGLDVEHHTGAVTFTVWDSGPGIAGADRSRLFTPFPQLEESNAGRTGTGLGLALVLRTARALGGDASVESGPNRGSRFTITLPSDNVAA